MFASAVNNLRSLVWSSDSSGSEELTSNVDRLKASIRDPSAGTLVLEPPQRCFSVVSGSSAVLRGQS